jgi:hypothetical protein
MIYEISKDRIVDILEDPAFYQTCPAYFFLRDQALAAVKAYKTAVAEKNCEGCNGTDASHLLASPIAGFVNVTADMHKENPELLLPLKRYLQDRIRYPVTEFSLRYKRKGKPQRIQF